MAYRLMRPTIGQAVTTPDNKEGVIRWLGRPVGSDGFTAGVELLERQRNSVNSGRLNGVRHFSCDPGHAVFLRVAELRLPGQPSPRKGGTANRAPRTFFSHISKVAKGGRRVSLAAGFASSPLSMASLCPGDDDDSSDRDNDNGGDNGSDNIRADDRDGGGGGDDDGGGAAAAVEKYARMVEPATPSVGTPQPKPERKTTHLLQVGSGRRRRPTGATSRAPVAVHVSPPPPPPSLPMTSPVRSATSAAQRHPVAASPAGSHPETTTLVVTAAATPVTSPVATGTPRRRRHHPSKHSKGSRRTHRRGVSAMTSPVVVGTGAAPDTGAGVATAPRPTAAAGAPESPESPESPGAHPPDAPSPQQLGMTNATGSGYVALLSAASHDGTGDGTADSVHDYVGRRQPETAPEEYGGVGGSMDELVEEHASAMALYPKSKLLQENVVLLKQLVATENENRRLWHSIDVAHASAAELRSQLQAEQDAHLATVKEMKVAMQQNQRQLDVYKQRISMLEQEAMMALESAAVAHTPASVVASTPHAKSTPSDLSAPRGSMFWDTKTDSPAASPPEAASGAHAHGTGGSSNKGKATSTVPKNRRPRAGTGPSPVQRSQGQGAASPRHGRQRSSSEASPPRSQRKTATDVGRRGRTDSVGSAASQSSANGRLTSRRVQQERRVPSPLVGAAEDAKAASSRPAGRRVVSAPTAKSAARAVGRSPGRLASRPRARSRPRSGSATRQEKGSGGGRAPSLSPAAKPASALDTPAVLAASSASTASTAASAAPAASTASAASPVAPAAPAASSASPVQSSPLVAAEPRTTVATAAVAAFAASALSGGFGGLPSSPDVASTKPNRRSVFWSSVTDQ